MTTTYMHNAALICGDCATQVRDELKTAPGWKYSPESDEGPELWQKLNGETFNADGETVDSNGFAYGGTDTDTFPADCGGLSSESDTVEFCDSGDSCPNAFKPRHIPGGPAPWLIGQWLENDLTQEGAEMLKLEIKSRPRNPVVAFCRAMYRDTLGA